MTGCALLYSSWTFLAVRNLNEISCVLKKKNRRRRRRRLHWPGKEEDTVESQDYYRSNVLVQIRSVKQNLRKIILFYLPNWGFWIRFGPTEVEKFVLSKLVQNRISIIIIRFRPNTHKPLFGRPLPRSNYTNVFDSKSPLLGQAAHLHREHFPLGWLFAASGGREQRDGSFNMFYSIYNIGSVHRLLWRTDQWLIRYVYEK